MINHHFLGCAFGFDPSAKGIRGHTHGYAYIWVQHIIVFRFVQLFEYDFKMSTINEKVKAGFAILGEYFYARDLILIFVALVVETLCGLAS